MPNTNNENGFTEKTILSMSSIVTWADVHAEVLLNYTVTALCDKEAMAEAGSCAVAAPG